MGINGKTEPFFSVIVPVNNNEQDLEKCIESILSQSYTDFELIIVDDGSTDTTPKICDRFAEQDSRVRVIHKMNEGVAAARNDGLFLARGKYIYYVDGDDWITERLLEEAACVLETSNPPDIFVFGYYIVQDNGQCESYVWPGRVGLYDKEQLEKEVYPRMYHTGITMRMGLVSGSLWDKIIKKDLLKRHYCRDASLFIHEDLVCAYECLYYAEQVYFSPDIMYFYNRFSESSMHRRYHNDLFENNQAAVEYLHANLGGKGNSSIDRQINKIGFDGLAAAIYQEITFGPSFLKSASLLKRKLKMVDHFPICPTKGLYFYEKLYVFLLSCRFVYVSLFLAKVLTALVGIWKKWKYHNVICKER